MKKPADRERRVERLLGRRVRGLDGAVVGRIEELRAEKNGDTYEVVEYHLGAGAMLERLGLVSRMLGRESDMYVVRWDQMTLTAGSDPQLTCDIREIRRRRR